MTFFTQVDTRLKCVLFDFRPCQGCQIVLQDATVSLHILNEFSVIFATFSCNFQANSSHLSNLHYTFAFSIFYVYLQVYRCTDCNLLFCNDCDLFVHETLHTCPGCTSIANIDVDNGIS